MASKTTGKVGGGRKTLAAKKLRDAGDVEGANAIAPPSEKALRLDPANCCGARTQSRDHKPCTRLKGYGTDHPGYGNCAAHGGNTPAVIKASMREMGRDLAIKYKANWRFGGDRTDPSIANLSAEDVMLEEVRRSAAMCRFLEERIARWNINSTQLDLIERFVTQPPTRAGGRTPATLDLKDAVRTFLDELPTEDPDSPWHLPPLMQTSERTGISSFTDLREWLYLYREERAHMARVAKMTIDAGVATRLVTLAEDQGRILATAIRAVLDALGLTPEQAAMVPKIVPPILRAVANNQPVPSLETLLGTDYPEPRALLAPQTPRTV